MTDIFSKEKRSLIMSSIRSKETKPEVKLRKRLWAEGLKYRKNYNLPGKPDVAFVKKKIVVFVDGCFWHKCPKCYKKPKSNKKYWASKIKYNVEKDKKINKELEEKGWKVLRFWEHDINKNIDDCVKKIVDEVTFKD